ncbi:MAG: hypothetical protein ACYTAN_01680 [Planctomycetota bacterium]|jgi:hypothetical protein
MTGKLVLVWAAEPHPGVGGACYVGFDDFPREGDEEGFVCWPLEGPKAARPHSAGADVLEVKLERPGVYTYRTVQALFRLECACEDCDASTVERAAS